MKKLMLTAFAVASLVAGAAVQAQGSGYDAAHPPELRRQPNPNNITPSGPIPGTPEYYGNSGWTPDLAYGDRARPQDYRAAYPPALAPGWATPREVQRERERRIAERQKRERELLRAERRERERVAFEQRRSSDRDWNRDRDGDGIRNRRDPYPDDSRRW